ncbi:bifunctional diaminohydroxyphosphoribosylaminopyrimidine deaminase/5-amino-6-(5-phosphoribosylamino)uracil reductase RibD [Neisseria sp. S1]|uniref:bifunctional diaminohydroxyphosphoribosylaminopyrimidine deaminase/5-amino-6-(5-phosphoribosylamino)uracil reductase RibD n=1 Tax=Neisseria sp. S1 TaxID=3318354 RepID=UPI003A846C5D
MHKHADTFGELDSQMMYRALVLARQGRFSTSPNPRVGCVLAKGSQVVGEGFHIMAGGPHAEVHALRQAGSLAQGSTAYVTLEPCSHYGRTPPCAKSLIEAGVSRVVAAMRDPNPLVGGKGLEMLQKAGIAVSCGLLENEARELNRGFLSRIERARPFVRLKCAASLDGKTALANGQSQWITGEQARADVQILRAESCAVITGIGTVLADNPQLNVRDFPTLRQPTRIVLDSRLQTPLNSNLIQNGTAPTIIATLVTETEKLQPYLHHPHVSVIAASEKNGRIDLPKLLGKLADLGFGEVMVEAGATLAGAFLEEELLDEIVVYQSPKILGGTGRGLFILSERPQVLTQKSNWQTIEVTTIGCDIRWTLRQ